MKPLLYSLYSLLCWIPLQSVQCQVIGWNKTYGGSETDYAKSLDNTLDGGLIVCGTTFSKDIDITLNKGQADIWILKLDTVGELEWQKNLGSAAIDYGSSAIQTSDGGYICIGSTYGKGGDVTFNHGKQDLWILKLDVNGAIQWQKCYGGSEEDAGTCIRETIDGGYIAGGYSNSSDGDVSGGHGQGDFWIIKIDESGNIQWQKTIGGNLNDFFSDILVLNNGDYLVLGTISKEVGDNDIHLVNVNTNGETLWEKSYGGSKNEYGYTIIKTVDGKFVICGSSESTDGDLLENKGGTDSWVFKIDTQGTVIWSKTIGGSLYDYAFSIKTNTIGTIMLAGAYASEDGDFENNRGANDIFVAKLDSAGKVAWMETYGGAGDDDCNAMQINPNGQLVVLATSSSSDGDIDQSKGKEDFWILGIDEVSIAKDIYAHSELSLFPNPARNKVNISQSNAQPCSLQIFSMTGHLMQSLDLIYPNQEIDVKNLNPGIYFLTFKGKDFCIYRSLMIQ